MRTCNKCGLSKDLNDFYRDKTKSEGREYICKGCKKNYNNSQGRNAHYKYNQKLRETILDHYGRWCAYCGSTEELQLDHVKGDGAILRRQHDDKPAWHRYLIKNNFPPDCQVLCRCCNAMKQNLTETEFKQHIMKLAAHFA